MKKLLLPLLAVLSLLATTAFADNINIGIVDVRQVLQKSPQMAAMQAKLREEFGARDKQIQAVQQQLQKDADNLNRNSAVLSQAQKDELNKKIQSEQENLRTMQMNFQRDLYAKQSDQMRSVISNLQDLIAKVAKAKNLNIVITKDAVAYANDAVDITNDVITEMGRK
jgi:outer membrane protein